MWSLAVQYCMAKTTLRKIAQAQREGVQLVHLTGAHDGLGGPWISKFKIEKDNYFSKTLIQSRNICVTM